MRSSAGGVDVDHGDIAVSHKAGAADCVLRAPKLLFLKIASGRENAMAAVLRGALVVEGDLDLLMAFATHTPGPASEAGSETSSETIERDSNVRKGESQWPMTW